MKIKLLIAANLVLLLAAFRAPAADDTNAVPAAPASTAPQSPATPQISSTDWAFYKIITERNIFDPNRRPGRGPGIRDNTQPIPRTDWFVLRGTSSYDDKAFAFFEGTSSQYRGQLKKADSIAGYRIAAIGDDHVKLAASGDKTIELRVGMQMRRTEGSPWRLVASPDSSPEPTTEASSDSSSTTGATSTATAPNGDAISDVMKKMMERRAKENGGQ